MKFLSWPALNLEVSLLFFLRISQTLAASMGKKLLLWVFCLRKILMKINHLKWFSDLCDGKKEKPRGLTSTCFVWGIKIPLWRADITKWNECMKECSSGVLVMQQKNKVEQTFFYWSTFLVGLLTLFHLTYVEQSNNQLTIIELPASQGFTKPSLIRYS